MNRPGYQASRVRRILVGAVLTAVLTHFIPESAGLSLTAGILYTAVALFWTLTLAHRVGPDHTKRLMVTMLQAYAEKMGYEIVPGADLSAYVDEDTISSWAEGSVAWAKAADLITGRSETTITKTSTMDHIRLIALFVIQIPPSSSEKVSLLLYMIYANSQIPTRAG